MARTSKAQKERQQRGEDFQNEMRASWRFVPNVWRMRIADGAGGSRPADEIILTPYGNILAEHKRTASDRFELSTLRAPQLKGLIDFEKVLPTNYGVVFVSFHNKEKGFDRAFAIRIMDALRYMQRIGHQYVPMKALSDGEVACAELPRTTLQSGTQAYDMEGLTEWFKSLSQTTSE